MALTSVSAAISLVDIINRSLSCAAPTVALDYLITGLRVEFTAARNFTFHA